MALLVSRRNDTYIVQYCGSSPVGGDANIMRINIMIGQPMFFVLTPQPMISFHHLHLPVKLSDRRANNSTNLSVRRWSYRPRADGSTLIADTV